MQIAHATYVLTTEEQGSMLGGDAAFLFSPFTHWASALLLVLGAAAVIAAVVYLPRIPVIEDRLRYLRGKARGYAEAVPWMLRIALGLALIGGGAEQYLLSPNVGISSGLALAQAILGFLMITGLFTAPVAITCVVLYLYGAVTHPELLGNAEFLTASLAVIAIGAHKPSLDDLLGLPAVDGNEQSRALVPLLLRIGIGISMIWMSLSEKLLNPHLFEGVVQKYDLSSIIPLDGAMWTLSVGLIELSLGTLILLGVHTRLAAALSYITIVGTFLYFGEHVSAHVTLFGVLAALFILGNGSYSLESWYAKRKLA